MISNFEIAGGTPEAAAARPTTESRSRLPASMSLRDVKIDAAATLPPNACGCASKPLRIATGERECLLDNYQDRPDDALQAAEDDFYWSVAMHEAGHAIAGLSYGWHVRHLTISNGTPHCLYEPKGADLSLEGFMVRSISGAIAQGIAFRFVRCPDKAEMLRHLTRARTADIGSCDSCHEAGALHVSMPQKSDADLIKIWRDFYWLTLRIFDSLEWRSSLYRVARVLAKEITLAGTDLDRLIDRDELRAAREALA
jgi:hypothetical protein